MIRFLTAGESHGKKLMGIIEGIPANLVFDQDYINNELRRRQIGYGRSERMKMESDEIVVLSGVSKGMTTGNPISIEIRNRGYRSELDEIKRPRPGHGDLPGALKYNQSDIRNILERASARETAMRVAIGSICKLLLSNFNIRIYSHVIQIGKIESNFTIYDGATINEIELSDKSPVRVIQSEVEKKCIEKIEETISAGDTLGGIFELVATNVPVGLGSHISWDNKLDGKIAQSIMSIPGIKGVEIGKGFQCGGLYGSEFHDEIFYEEERYTRKTNNAGGIEGGISNGENIVVRAVMKPIPTLKKPLKSINMDTKEVSLAHVERSDVCAVPSASIVGESMLAFTLAKEFHQKFGGDSIEEVMKNYRDYIKYITSR